MKSTAADISGEPIAELLSHRCHEWEDCWKELDESDETFAEAKWKIPDSGGGPERWFAVCLTRFEGGKLFCISSTPAPLEQLQEQGCDRCLSSEPSRRESFFRLIRASERLNQLVSRWPGIVFTQRPDGSFYYISPKIEELTGVGAAEWEQKPGLMWSVIHEADLPGMREHFRAAAAAAPLPLTRNLRLRHAKTGKVVYVQEHRQAVKTKSGLLLGFEGVWIDITRLTLVEKRLNTAVWKETLSALTSGLVHDFRNMMTAVISMSELFLQQIEPDHPFYSGLSVIRSNAWQATQSMHRILKLYNGQSGDCQYADINELVPELQELCRKMLSRRIRVDTELSEGRLPVFLDPFEFRQALLNLAVNARDAMPEGGTLRIKTSRHLSLPANLGFVKGVVPRVPAVCITVTDTGSGIPAENLASIFDAFYTTKGPENGCGLGLYNVLGFMEKNHGAVSVQTAPGQGAAFSLWLPEADFTEGDSQSASAPAAVALLLFGDTDPALNSMAERLRIDGFDVVIATDNAAASKCLHSSEYRFDAVLMQTTAKCPGFFADIKKERLPVKTILQVVACNQDELQPSLLSTADLVLSSDSESGQIAARIRSLLSAQSDA